MSAKFSAIVCTPGICAGAPRLAGHRLNVYNIVSILEDWSFAEFIQNYCNINEDSLRQALRYCSSRECERDQPEHYCDGCKLRCINDGQSFDDFLIGDKLIIANPEGEKPLVEGAMNYLGSMEELRRQWEGREGWTLAKMVMKRLNMPDEG